MSYRRVGDDPLHPCESGEEPLRWYHYTVIPLVALLFPFRLAILVASLLLSATVCAMCCVGCEPNSDGSYELSGTRRAILLLLGRAIGRIVLLCFGVWPGLLEVRGALDPRASVVVMAPHVGLVEGIFCIYDSFPRPVILKPYIQIPLIRQLFCASGGLAVPLRAMGSASAPAPASASAPEPVKPRGAIKEAILRHKRSYDPAAGMAPVVLLPEGVTHNGLSILKFFSGAFEGGTPVQPLTIEYPFVHYNAAAFLSTLPVHLLRLLVTPHMRVRANYLPLHTPSDAECADAELMAANVREIMARSLNLPLSEYGSKELRVEFAKKGAPAGRGKQS